MKQKLNAAEEVGTNKDGWYCLRHKDGWLVGTEKGVTCYRQEYIAKAALTFACERENGRMVYKIDTFRLTKDLKPAGEHTPLLLADEAWKNLERKMK
jgi:hypothetical protein